MDLTSAKSAYELIAGLGFPFTLFLLVFGSYLGVYYWGNAVRAERAEWKAREAKLEATIAKLENRNDDLMDKMVEAAGLLRESVRVQARR